ncbi:MAG: DUF4143 domain-containing protein [Bacteroidetes bacterium]|nr:DUF4143 domain-containing protein [Bacteroidota bacterium]
MYFLKSYFNWFNKRVIKAPKLYFNDTGLACWLLSIHKPDQIDTVSLYKGALFENFVINEMIKYRFNRGLKNNLYYFRDSNANEVDVIIDNGKELIGVEIISARTLANDFFKGLDYWKKLSGQKKSLLFYTGFDEFKYSNGNQVINWKNIAGI